MHYSVASKQSTDPLIRRIEANVPRTTKGARGHTWMHACCRSPKSCQEENNVFNSFTFSTKTNTPWVRHEILHFLKSYAASTGWNHPINRCQQKKQNKIKQNQETVSQRHSKAKHELTTLPLRQCIFHEIFALLCRGEKCETSLISKLGRSVKKFSP